MPSQYFWLSTDILIRICKHGQAVSTGELINVGTVCVCVNYFNLLIVYGLIPILSTLSNLGTVYWIQNLTSTESFILLFIQLRGATTM